MPTPRIKIRKIHDNTTSKYRGVSKTKRLLKPWVAVIHINNKRTQLGYFSTEEAAAKAWDKAAIELYGNEAPVNFKESFNSY